MMTVIYLLLPHLAGADFSMTSVWTTSRISNDNDDWRMRWIRGSLAWNWNHLLPLGSSDTEHVPSCFEPHLPQLRRGAPEHLPWRGAVENYVFMDQYKQSAKDLAHRSDAIKHFYYQARGVVQWWSTCLMYSRPWVQYLAQEKEKEKEKDSWHFKNLVWAALTAKSVRCLFHKQEDPTLIPAPA